MKQFFIRIFTFFDNIQSKMAFYPAILAFSGSFLAFLMIYLEGFGLSDFLLEHFSILVVNSGETALTILSVCIGGIISMVVFSFSMVMILLNQAANNYSPRLLPGLISDKKHQVILGIFLATILYCIFILFSVQPTLDKYQVPGFSILLGILSTVISICTFIYFIHNISQSIQINKILGRIHKVAERRLNHIIEMEKNLSNDFPSTTHWNVYYAEKSGYFQNISLKNLLGICEKDETQLHILRAKGTYVLKGFSIFKSKRKLENKTVKDILSNMNFSNEELLDDNYVLVFKQITEIIVKAMSPAVNDPGTAINGIDYLTDLFATRMQKKDKRVILKEGTVYIKLSSINFRVLMYNVMASIRAYCKHDVVVVQKLAYMFMFLKAQNAIDQTYYKCIVEEAKNLLEDSKSTITNKKDQEKIVELTKMLKIEV